MNNTSKIIVGIDLSKGECQKELEEYLDQQMWVHIERAYNFQKDLNDSAEENKNSKK